MCTALVMVVAGVSMLANAMPSIAASLDASQSSQQWIVDAYALVLAALLLPAGAIGDRFGRRGALIAGTAIFGIGSLLSAFVDSAGPLIGLRALTGLGAALLMPGTLSTITSVFPPEERAKAVGIWAGFAGAGGTLGILVSGALLEQFWWGSIFLVTAGLAALSCIGVILVVPSTRSEEHVGLDPRGSVISAIGIGLLVLGIIEGPERGWTNPLTLVGLIGGVAFLVAFIAVELRTDEPLLDPRLFQHRGFATGSASLFLQFFAMFGFFFVSLQFLQLVLGYSTFEAALALLPMSIVILPISYLAGTLSETYGHRLIGGIGLAVSAVGFGLFATLGTGSGFLSFMFVTIVIGAGAALAMTLGHQRDHPRRSPRRQAGCRARRSMTRRASSAPRSASPCSAARSTSGTATPSTITSSDCRPRSRTRRVRRRRSRCSSRRASPVATRSAPRHVRRSRPGCATRCSWACALLAKFVGAVFVWFRGKALDGRGGRGRARHRHAPVAQAPGLSVPAEGAA